MSEARVFTWDINETVLVSRRSDADANAIGVVKLLYLANVEDMALSDHTSVQEKQQS